MKRSNREPKDLQWFGYKDTFLALLHSSSTELESFLHQINNLPYGGENLTHENTHHNFVTTQSQLLHNFFTPIYFTPIYFTPIFFTPFYFLTLLLHASSIFTPSQLNTIHYFKIYTSSQLLDFKVFSTSRLQLLCLHN